MGFLFSNTKIADFIKRHFLLKSLIKGSYRILMFPFTRHGVEIDIGGLGKYRLDYMFALRGYDSFGDKHNAGFKEWVESCRGKKVVFDVGAHIGLYTLPASRVVAPQGKVYAFEPSGANRKYLMHHFRYNNINNAVIAQYLVGGDSRKERLFYENNKTDPMNSLCPKKNAWLYKKVFREQVALDDFVRWNNVEPQVIKIDVEGAEYDVLKGASKTIKKCSPVIFLSIHPNQLVMLGSSTEKISDLISDLRYDAYNCSGERAQELGSGEYILRKKNGDRINV